MCIHAAQQDEIWKRPMEAPHAYAPRIYFVHSPLVGRLDAWPAQFEHAAALGFDHVLIGGLFQPG